MPGEAACALARRQRLGCLCVVAGFQVSIDGRFWVSTEGFVSASIHKSVDNTRVVNYAQWRTKDDFDAMRTNPEAIPHMKAAAALASFDPIACEVAESIAR
jgi:hypothetical protein